MVVVDDVVVVMSRRSTNSTVTSVPVGIKSSMSSTAKPAPRMQSGMKLKKQAKPAVKKLPSSSLVDDGWDDF